MRSKMIGMPRIRKKRGLPRNWHTARRLSILLRRRVIREKSLRIFSRITIDSSKSRLRGVILMS